MASEATIKEAAAVLRRGEPALFPTETVYGLGVAVGYAEGPDAIFELKGRDRSKPVAWLISEAEDLLVFGKVVPEFVRVLANTFWPGPLTLIVRASDLVPESFRSAEDTIGLRMPSNETALALIRELGCPIATSSANKAGFPAVKCFDDLDPDLLASVPVAVRDDIEKSGLASSVIDCTKEHPVMMRSGAITVADIQALS